MYAIFGQINLNYGNRGYRLAMSLRMYWNTSATQGWLAVTRWRWHYCIVFCYMWVNWTELFRSGHRSPWSRRSLLLSTVLIFLLDERVTFQLQRSGHCLVHLHMLHYLCVGLCITQSDTHTMQQTHMHKTVTRQVITKKLLSRQRQSEYSDQQDQHGVTGSKWHPFFPAVISILLR